MLDVGSLSSALDGAVYVPGSPGYDEMRRPENVAFRDARPALVVACASVGDVVRSVHAARRAGAPLVPRGGGHCFAGRSTTDGMVLDLSAVNGIQVADDGTALVGAGARLGPVYSSLHAAGRSLPAGCGATVGIAGLTLGGGIGLLGRSFGLTSDRLVGAQVVLADGEVVECDAEREADLFWALRGAGGGQFGIVTALRFRTVEEPTAIRIDARISGVDVDVDIDVDVDLAVDAAGEVVAAWQSWAPDAPDGLTLDLTIAREAAGRSLVMRLSGASLLSVAETREALGRFGSLLSVAVRFELGDPMPYVRLKEVLADDERSSARQARRIRSEFFAAPMREGTIRALVGLLGDADTDADTDGGGNAPGAGPRRLTFTAMAGAYNRVAENATAFAHRDQRYLLEHVGAAGDPWVDASWEAAHPDASGRVYPNFPDPLLGDPLAAYHAGNASRLAAVKQRYDQESVFWFEQGIRPSGDTSLTRQVHDTAKHDTEIHDTAIHDTEKEERR